MLFVNKEARRPSLGQQLDDGRSHALAVLNFGLINGAPTRGVRRGFANYGAIGYVWKDLSCQLKSHPRLAASPARRVLFWGACVTQIPFDAGARAKVDAMDSAHAGDRPNNFLRAAPPKIRRPRSPATRSFRSDREPAEAALAHPQPKSRERCFGPQNDFKFWTAIAVDRAVLLPNAPLMAQARRRR